MRAFISRLLDVILRRTRDTRLDEEVQAHLDLLIDEYIAKGMTPDDARLAARKSFGGVDQMKERYRDQRGWPLFEELGRDVRYALRLIARDRWFTAATVLALALGLGAASTMATLLYSINFRGLPFHEAHQLIGIGGEPSRTMGGQVPFAVFEAWRTASRTVSAMTAEVDAPINLGDETHGTDQFGGTFLTHEVFAILGERPVLGREFRAEDERPGAPPVAIIGHRLWADRYGSDPAVIGRTVRTNGQPATVIGIMPEGFQYPIDTQIWRPLTALPGMDTRAAAERPVRVVGRLTGGVTIEQARAELAALVSTLTTIPATERRRRTVVMTLNETRVGPTWQPIPMMMMAAVLVVLLIACSHAASLLLARASARTRELSMRAALGASRARMIRQLLVESVITALFAGVIGLGIVAAFVRAFANEVSGFGLPYWTRFTFDLPIVGMVALLCLGSGIVFGLLPALRMSRTNLIDVMGQGGRSGAGPRTQRLTTALLVGEIALTVILLSSAGALVRSANVVYRADQTIDVANLWTFRLSLPPAVYDTSEKRAAFYRTLDAYLAVAPGVESAAIANGAPFNARDSRGVVMDTESPAERDPGRSASLIAIGDRYFDTLGLRVLRGRRLEDLDPATRATAALVNERFVERYLPGSDAIGRQLLLFNERAPDVPPRRVTIAGIAPPLRQQVANSHRPAVYVPYDTENGVMAALIIRGRPEQFAGSLRAAIRRLDPDLPLYDLQSLERVSYMSRWVYRITSTVFSIVAVIATLLAAVGLFSLTAYAASQRTQEIGVRMALGAQRSQVSWLFLRRALWHAAIGLAIGLIGAVTVGGALQGMMAEVRANQPLMLAGVALFLLAIALAAALMPALRASRLDPVTALRQE